MASYDVLRNAQSQLQLELTQLAGKFSMKLTIKSTERAAFLKEINHLSDEFAKNHLLLGDLLKNDASLANRAYFSLKNDQIFHKEVEKMTIELLRLNVIDEKAMEPTMKDLQTQMEAMALEILELHRKGAGGGKSDQVLTELLQEFKAARVLLKFPVFPKAFVYKCYREWRSAVNNFLKTNLVSDSVKIQHLKEACLGTEADQIVSLFCIDVDTFAAAMSALDNQFLVSRIIVSEYIGAAVNLTANHPKGGQSHHLKEVIDTFSALSKNLEGICRESLGAKGLHDPTPEQMSNAISNALLMGLLFRTIDDNLKTAVSSSLNLQSMELPAFRDVLGVLEKRLLATQSGETSRSTAHFVAVTHVKGSSKSCVLCPGGTHATYNCRKLSVPGMSFQAKIQLLKNNSGKVKICWICLDKPMEVCDCRRSSKVCGGCGGSHHRVLCGGRKPKGHTQNGKPGYALAPKASVATVVAMTNSVPSTAVLGTMLVKVRAKTGEFVTMRCMVDDGSMVSYITTQAFQLLGCNFQKTFKEVRSVDGESLDPITKEVNLQLQTLDESLPRPFLMNEVAVARRVPLILPSRPIHLDISQANRDAINFADRDFETPKGIDILIGTGPWALMKLEGSKSVGMARLQNSLFGFVVQGSVAVKHKGGHSVVATIVSCESFASIRDDFKKAFEHESAVEEDDEFSEHLFEECHERLPTGQYVVPLLWGTDRKLGDSYNVCFKRNQRVLERLKPVQVSQMLDVLSAYRDADIITLCSDGKQGEYYAPFVMVWRKSVTTPLRICLDASQKSTNGLSVNDIQLIGAKLQPDLVEQLLRFRQHPVAMIADIAQMYLNILVREADRKFQRSILNLPGRPVQEIEYNTVLFGATCAPYLAQRTIKQLAHDEVENYPEATNILLTSCYIDDIIYSVEDIKQAQETIDQLIKACASAKFTLHKIASSDSQALEHVAAGARLSAVDAKDTSSVLGVQWQHTGADKLFIETPSKSITNWTKRSALSMLASIFDPLGLLTPALMPARFIIQEVWKRDRHLKSAELIHTWDKPLPEDLGERFHQWFDEFKSAPQIRFDRYCGFMGNSNQAIFAFTDASTQGYGAVVYLRITNALGNFEFRLLVSKGRVAPVVRDQSEKIAALTIPRLELMGALVGAELVNKVRNAWNLDKDFPIFMFTDSEIVLAQITRSAIRDVFSENRLRKIRHLVEPKCWFHVPTEENPADLITRGTTARGLEGFWENGPKSMCSMEFIPSNKFREEEKPELGVHVVEVKETKGEMPFAFLSKFSSFLETTRVMVCVLQAVDVIS